MVVHRVVRGVLWTLAALAALPGLALLLLGGLLAGYWMVVITWGLPAGVAETAPLPGGATLAVERRVVSPLGLAEYRRTLVLRRDGRTVLRSPLILDHGGVNVINLYGTAAGRILVVDRLSATEVDPRSGTLHEQLRGCDAGRPEGASYLGALEDAPAGEGRTFRFVPPSEHAEVPVMGDATQCEGGSEATPPP